LLVAIFVLAISLLLVLAFMDSAALESQSASYSLHYVQARYVAQAGAEDAIATYRQDPSAVIPYLIRTEFPAGSGHYYEHQMLPTASNPGGRTITATGTVAGISRAVTAEVELIGTRILVRRWEEL